MLEIPVGIDENDYTIEFEAEEFSVVIHMRWNSEANLWIAGLQTLDGAPIVYGLPVLHGRFMLDPYSGLEGVPPGDLVAMSDKGCNPERDSFLDGSARLYYLTKAENAALQ